MELVVAIYAMTEVFPRTEQYGLTSQIRRCAVSIPSNIAEGSKRRTKADFRNFLSIALGSSAELETQFEIAKRLKFVERSAVNNVELLLTEVCKMLTTLTVGTHD